jgi:hypothetical protein
MSKLAVGTSELGVIDYWEQLKDLHFFDCNIKNIPTLEISFSPVLNIPLRFPLADVSPLPGKIHSE